jgi:protein-disulfide isomerase
MSDIKNHLPYIVIGSVFVIFSFVIGTLYTKVQYLERGAGNTINVSNPDALQAPDPQPMTADNVRPVSAEDHVKGDRNAPIALIEYSDFECFFCKTFHETAQQAVDEYDGKLMWVYRHFPLDSLHPNARKVSEASECAGKLGGNDAFWAYADKVYENTPDQGGYSEATLMQIARDINLNMNEFTTCLNSGEMASKVEEHLQSGFEVGIKGTPGNILLNTVTGETRLMPGAVPLPQLKTAIDQMLSEI